jgi:hypothetical protein
VSREIVGGPVGKANALHPAVGALHLAVPAVSSIVGHLTAWRTSGKASAPASNLAHGRQRIMAEEATSHRKTGNDKLSREGSGDEKT